MIKEGELENREELDRSQITVLERKIKEINGVFYESVRCRGHPCLINYQEETEQSQKLEPLLALSIYGVFF